jgi:protocatechuate 3,4-dioxygenase beta subunit
MRKALPALVTTFVLGVALDARVDPVFLRQWNDAQKQRPSTVTSSSRIAPAAEPGTPFIIHGQVIDVEGKPAPAVEIFAYHTDGTGLYAKPGATDPWRLKGWAITDAQGRFEFKTIRPAPYPGREIPAHVHLSLVTQCCGRQFAEVMFDDDPIATPAYRSRNSAVLFGKVDKRTDGSQETSCTVRLRPRGDF